MPVRKTGESKTATASAPVGNTLQEEASSALEQIADKGSPFNVLSLPEPDTTLDIMDREIGGLRVHFIRKLSDSISYRRKNGQNILRMVFDRRQEGVSGEEV